MPERAVGRLRSQTESLFSATVRALAFLGFLSLGACGLPTGIQEQGSDENRAIPGATPDQQALVDMVEAGLTYIDQGYVRSVSLEQIALAGLKNLHKLDPGISFRTTPLGVVMQNKGFERGVKVADKTSPKDWAVATTASLSNLKRESVVISRASQTALYETLFEGYTDQLDEFSRYLSPREVVQQDARFLGFGGLGINIDNEPNGIRVLDVLEDTPASRVGLRRGDLIVAVDGVSLSPSDEDNARSRALRGAIGSMVTIRVRRNGQEADVEVQRDEVIANSVDSEYRDGIAYLGIRTFNSGTPISVLRKLLEITLVAEEQGQEPRGVILDVRGNGGGLRAAVVLVADLFLEEGTITSTKGRLKRANRSFDTELGDLTSNTPLVVLINEDSASASELLAAAIQDNQRGVVIGSTSFGKGSVQSKLELPNRGELSLTTAEFYGPSGVPLHRYGVVPSLCTSNTVENPASQLSRLSRGKLGIPAQAARMAFNQNPNFAPRIYRSFCPPSVATPERDLELARGLIRQPKLLRWLATISQPPGGFF